MLFNSYTFIFAYVPIVVGGCFALSARFGARIAQDWLILASLAFYGVWNLQFLPLLLGSIVFNFVAAKTMIRSGPALRQTCLILAITVDLALLGYYKYANFFVTGFDELSGAQWFLGTIALPLGISFYTFQQITLLVDVSQGRIDHFRFRDFLLFVTFFPHLIAGPIVHHREMMPQFEKAKYAYDPENLAVGVTLFAAGLFKKTVIADGISSNIAPFFQLAHSGRHLTFLDAWTAALGFTLQIYFDFSGYSEMALGLARMVGIKLPMNFNSPLKATNIIDFWQRWNMTLTRFLTAYIYNPLTLTLVRRRLRSGRTGIVGARTSAPSFVLLIATPTITTMFLSGLWHGAGYQFLVFGLLHGFYLVTCHGWRLYRSLFWPDEASYKRVMAPVGLVLTFCAVMVALLYFKADSVASATSIVAGMLGLNGVTLPEGVIRQAPKLAELLASSGVRFEPGHLLDLVNLWIVAPFAIAMFAPNVLEIMRDYQPAITLPAPSRASGLMARVRTALVWRPTTKWAMLTSAAAAMGILTLTKVTEFLYWQF
jgi:alginate O-acetyltransferase complex protein AlgI